MIKQSWILLFGLFLLFGMSLPANATLWDRGGGLIYDDVLNITWLQDANYAMTSGYDADGLMTWQEAVAWADQLVYGEYDDWRLPTIYPINGITYNWTWSYDGSTDWGYNITSPNNEMSYMFYVVLGNLGLYDTAGKYPQLGWGLTNSGPFENLQEYAYWTDVRYFADPEVFWVFEFNYGEQTTNGGYPFFAWAVRNGDVAAPVPEPATMVLLSSELISLARFNRRFFKK